MSSVGHIAKAEKAICSTAGLQKDKASAVSTIKVFMMDLWTMVPYYDAYLCRALQAAGVEVTLGAITYYLDPACFSQRGIHNRPGLLDVVGKYCLPGFLRRSMKFIEAMLNMCACAIRLPLGRCNMVHVQFLPLYQRRLPIEIWFLRYCRSLGMKLVYTVHDILPHDTGERHRESYQRLYRMMDALICHSESIKQRLVREFGIEPERIWIVPHGPFFYDCAAPDSGQVRTRYKLAEGECLVLWQGIIFPYKGVEFLLDAWADYQHEKHPARLVIAGTGNPQFLNTLRRKAESLGISGSVEFDFRYLAIDELTSLYQAADVVVYPYKAVTTSGALLSGIAQGRAIVATRLPTFMELLTDKASGLLVDYGDVAALSAAIGNLVAEPELRRNLGACAKNLNSGDAAWQSIAALTQNCYRAVLNWGFKPADSFSQSSPS